MSVATALKQATRTIGSLISGEPSDPEILDTLKKEHEEAGELLKKLVDSDSGAERKTLLAKIEAALIPHLQAEQTVLYDALIASKDKKIRQNSQEGSIEHALASTTLAKLGAIADANSSEFAACAKVLKELIEHHVQEEERNVWADAKERFSLEQRIVMNGKYLAAKKAPAASAKAPVVRKAAAIAPKKATPASKKAAAAPKKVISTAKKTTGAAKASVAAKPARSHVKPARPTA